MLNLMLTKTTRIKINRFRIKLLFEFITLSNVLLINYEFVWLFIKRKTKRTGKN